MSCTRDRTVGIIVGFVYGFRHARIFAAKRVFPDRTFLYFAPRILPTVRSLLFGVVSGRYTLPFFVLVERLSTEQLTDRQTVDLRITGNKTVYRIEVHGRD